MANQDTKFQSKAQYTLTNTKIDFTEFYPELRSLKTLSTSLNSAIIEYSHVYSRS